MPAKKTAKKMPAFIEKKTGEKYASKTAMKKHENSEPMSAMSKEYGKKIAMKKMAMRKKAR